MKKKTALLIGVGLLFTFVIWTLLLLIVDVGSVGPMGSSVGFARFNIYFHSLTGVNMHLYTLTDWLGLVPIGTALFFAVLGLCEWIKRKSILKVDRSILILGAFYIVTLAAYIFFESYERDKSDCGVSLRYDYLLFLL